MSFLSLRFAGALATFAACLVFAAPAGATNSNNTVSFTSPDDGAVLAAAPTVTWTADGAFQEAPDCEVTLAGTGSIFNDLCGGSLIGSDYPNGIYNFSWDTTSLIEPEGDGTYTVTFRPAWLNAGGATTFSRTFTVDTVAPTVYADGPSGPINDNTPTVGFIVYDANPGTSYCAVDPADSSDPADYEICPADSFDLAALSDGPHSFWILHRDLAGRIGSASKSFTVDATPPAISVSGVAQGEVLTSAYAAVSVGATDGSGSGLTTLGCWWDDGAVRSCNDTQFVNSVLVDGAHTLHVEATDALGNTATAAIAFSVDTTGGLKQGLAAPKRGSFKLKRGKLRSGKYAVTLTTTFATPAGGAKADCKGTATTRVLLKKKQLTSGKIKWKAAGGKCTATAAVKLKKSYRGKKLTVILDYKNGPIKAFRLSKTLKL